MKGYQGTYEMGTKKTPRITFWRVSPLEYRLCLLGECSRNPSVSVYQLALLWEAVFGINKFFLKTLSMSLPISWRVITSSPAHTALSVQQFLTKNGMTPMSHSPCSLSLTLSDFFFFPWMKKLLRGKHFAVEEVKQKTTETLKGIKIDEFKNSLRLREKSLHRYIASNAEGDWSLNM